VEQQQNLIERRIDQIRNASGVTVCLPLWRVQQLEEELAVKKLELKIKKHHHKHKKILAILGNPAVTNATILANSTLPANPNNNATTPVSNNAPSTTANNGTPSSESSEDSDESELDDNQTEEDDSESPNDDSNQTSSDDSEGDPDDS